MAISLSKNQVVNLSKESAGLENVIVGLGWDPVKPAAGIKGWLTSMSGVTRDIDCDAFCVTIGSNNSVIETIYYGHRHGASNAIKHCGDNLTGAGEGDDEQIKIDLRNMPSNINKIVVGVNIYNGKDRGQHFGTIKNAFIRIVNAKNNKEICKYDLSGKEYSGYLTVVFGELEKNSAGEWNFKALGEPNNAESIGKFTRSII